MPLQPKCYYYSRTGSFILQFILGRPAAFPDQNGYKVPKFPPVRSGWASGSGPSGMENLWMETSCSHQQTTAVCFFFIILTMIMLLKVCGIWRCEWCYINNWPDAGGRLDFWQVDGHFAILRRLWDGFGFNQVRGRADGHLLLETAGNDAPACEHKRVVGVWLQMCDQLPLLVSLHLHTLLVVQDLQEQKGRKLEFPLTCKEVIRS